MPVLLVAPGPVTTGAAVAFDLVLALAAVADLWRGTRLTQLRVRREVSARLPLGETRRVRLIVDNASDRPARLRIADRTPSSFGASPEVVEIAVNARSRGSAEYAVRPTRRGVHELGDLDVRWCSPAALACRQRRVPARESVRVLPGVGAIGRFELAARAHRLDELGLTASRRRGEGLIFESLRDYAPGDPLSRIGWKASARRGRLVTRLYEADRAQDVLILIDCGRLMVSEVAGSSRLDHAVTAALLLAHVASRQGDHVGLLAWSDRIEAYLPPRRGRGALASIADALSRLEPRLVESDADLACRFLALRQRKRSLLVIITDVVDREASAPLLAHAARFARRHLPLAVTLTELDVEAAARRRPEDSQALHEQAVALRLLARRQEALESMRRSGVDVLDVDPRALTPRLVSRYLDIKARHRL